MLWCGPPVSLTDPWCLGRATSPLSTLNSLQFPLHHVEIHHCFTPCTACVFRQSCRTTRDAPRLSADLPAIAPILRCLRYLLSSNHLLLSTIANSSFSISIATPSSNIAFSFEKEGTQPRALPSETPDRCREGLTSELSFLGPVSSSVDLTSPQETYTLSDSPAPSQAPSYTVPHSPRHPFSDHCTLCTLHTPSSSRRPHIHAPSPHCRDSLHPPSQHAFFHGPSCT